MAKGEKVSYNRSYNEKHIRDENYCRRKISEALAEFKYLLDLNHTSIDIEQGYRIVTSTWIRWIGESAAGSSGCREHDTSSKLGHSEKIEF